MHEKYAFSYIAKLLHASSCIAKLMHCEVLIERDLKQHNSINTLYSQKEKGESLTVGTSPGNETFPN